MREFHPRVKVQAMNGTVYVMTLTIMADRISDASRQLREFADSTGLTILGPA